MSAAILWQWCHLTPVWASGMPLIFMKQPWSDALSLFHAEIQISCLPFLLHRHLHLTTAIAPSSTTPHLPGEQLSVEMRVSYLSDDNSLHLSRLFPQLQHHSSVPPPPPPRSLHGCTLFSESLSGLPLSRCTPFFSGKYSLYCYEMKARAFRESSSIDVRVSVWGRRGEGLAWIVGV